MIKRDDPCPCGSGRQFKKCCMLKHPGPGDRNLGEYQFEPGSHGGPGGYSPSLACFRELASGERDYRFVLASPDRSVGSERDAIRCATADFSAACRVDDATGSVEAMGRQLGTRGYVVVVDARVTKGA